MGQSSRDAKSRRRFLQALAGAPVLACSGLSSASQVGPTLDVTTLGADPTGVMDSADAVQQAVDLLPASGGTVFFPPGDYLMHPKASPLEDHYNRWPREHISFAAVELRRSHTTFLGHDARLVLDQPLANRAFSGLIGHQDGLEFYAEGPFHDRTSQTNARKPWRVLRGGTTLSEEPLVCLPPAGWTADSGLWRFQLTGSHASLLPDGPADLFRGDARLTAGPVGALSSGEWAFDPTTHRVWVADDPATEDVQARPLAGPMKWSWDPVRHRVYSGQAPTDVLLDDAINFIFANRRSQGLSNLRFEGLTFDPNFDAGDQTNHRGMLLLGCEFVDLVQCRLGNFGPTAKGGNLLDFMDCHDVTLKDCLIKKAFGGAAFIYCSRVRIEDTRFENVHECLDFDKPNEDIVITNAVINESNVNDFCIDSNATRGLQIDSLSSVNTGRLINFSGKITWPDFGSLVAGSANLIFLPGVDFTLRNSSIEDSDLASDCISIGDKWDPPLCSPGAGHPGIEPTREVVIEANTFRRTSRVRVKEGLDVRIAENRFEDCISSAGEAASIPNGVIFGETENRLAFWPTAPEYSRLQLEVSDNVFERCDKSAIAVERAQSLRVEHNQVTDFSCAADNTHYAVRLSQLDWSSGQKIVARNLVDGGGKGAGGVILHAGNPSDEVLSIEGNAFANLLTDIPFKPSGFGHEIVEGKQHRARWQNFSASATLEWVVLEEDFDLQLVDVELATQSAIAGSAGDSLKIALLRRNVATATDTTILELERFPPIAKGTSFSLGREAIFSSALGVARGPIAFVLRVERLGNLAVGRLRTLASFVTV